MGNVVDGSTPIRWTGTPAQNVDITSAAFTAPSGAVLVACLTADTQSNTAETFSFSDSGGLTWTKRIQCDKANFAAVTGGHSAIWTATTVSAVSRTVSVRRTSTVANRISAKCYVVTGQHASPFGATGSNWDTTNNVTAAIFTSTAANSFAFVAATDWNQRGSPVSSDLTEDSADYAGTISVTSGYKDCAATGAQTANLDAGGTSAAAWTWAALEIKAAPAAAASPGRIVNINRALERAAYW
jgi:hypothetical protein